MKIGIRRAILTGLVALAPALPAAAQTLDKPSLSIQGARRVIAAVRAEATAKNAPGAVIAVVDDGGNLMALERLDGVRGAAWIITAGSGQQRTERHLISANEQNEDGTHVGRLPVSDVGRRTGRRVVGACRRGPSADRLDITAQRVEPGVVRFATSPDGDVSGRRPTEGGQQLDAGELAKTTLESVPVDR